MDRDTSADRQTTPHEEPEDSDRRKPEVVPPNPPRTQTGPIAAPKFGSAGSGGAELEPGPERD